MSHCLISRRGRFADGEGGLQHFRVRAHAPIFKARAGAGHIASFVGERIGFFGSDLLTARFLQLGRGSVKRF
jgi:hypothetical protein